MNMEELEGLSEVELERRFNAGQYCQRCGQGVLVMIAKNSGYCSQVCEEQA